MATYSGSYSFSSIQSAQIIEDAYERLSIISDSLTSRQILSAQRSLNFIIKAWYNKGIHLFQVQTALMSLTENQYAYTLPSNVIDLLEVSIRTSSRLLGGTADSSAGTANNAFDADTSTYCDAGINGWISYEYSSNTLIEMVGIQSETTTDYTIELQYSYDGTNWYTLQTEAQTSYAAGTIQWISVASPVSAPYFLILETGGADLNIEELYLNANLYDTQIARVSRYEWMANPQKNQTGKPGNFYLDRQITPIINLWPAPSASYNTLFYSYTSEVEDVGALTDTIAIPSRFLEAITARLAFNLAVKEGKLDRIEFLKNYSDELFSNAQEEDTERVPLRLMIDSKGYYE
jgi:hypothetical protein